MTSINTIGATGTTANAVTPKGNGTLDQTAFLKLMTTQLQTQDPFDPIDNTQMVAQMAQFSSVTGIAEMNASLKAISAELAAARVSDAASWIGRDALVESDTAAPLADGSYKGEVALAEDANNLVITLVDEQGAVVHREAVGATKKGTVAFDWDGKNDAGQVAATGKLKVVVEAAGAKGAVETAVAVWTPITSVQSPAGGSAKLVTPLGLVTPADAIRLG